MIMNRGTLKHNPTPLILNNEYTSWKIARGEAWILENYSPIHLVGKLHSQVLHSYFVHMGIYYINVGSINEKRQS